MNDAVNEHVYTVNKRVSIREETGVNSKELRSEIINHTLPRHRRKYNSGGLALQQGRILGDEHETTSK